MPRIALASVHAARHNEAISYIFRHLTHIPKRRLSHVLRELYADYCFMRGLHLPEVIALPPLPTEFRDIDLDFWIREAPVTFNLKLAARELIAVIDGRPSYLDFDAALTDVGRDYLRRLDRTERARLVDMLIVARQSFRLYLGSGHEHLDFFQDIARLHLDETGHAPRRSGINWWKVVACDCLGGIAGHPAGFTLTSAYAVLLQL